MIKGCRLWCLFTVWISFSHKVPLHHDWHHSASHWQFPSTANWSYPQTRLLHLFCIRKKVNLPINKTSKCFTTPHKEGWGKNKPLKHGKCVCGGGGEGGDEDTKVPLFLRSSFSFWNWNCSPFFFQCGNNLVINAAPMWTSVERVLKPPSNPSPPPTNTHHLTDKILNFQRRPKQQTDQGKTIASHTVLPIVSLL